VAIESHAASIGTITDDLEWPWMAVSRIARYLCGSWASWFYLRLGPRHSIVNNFSIFCLLVLVTARCFAGYRSPHPEISED